MEHKIQIDLNGSEGNAFALIARAKQLCKKLDIPSEDIIKKMRSGDYENLLKVFEENFSDYIELVW